MKNVIIAFALLLGSTLFSFGQHTEGHMKYTIDISSDNPEMEMAAAMLVGSSMEIYFKDEKSKSIMQMGTMMKMTTIVDNASKEHLMLMDGMMGKKAVRPSNEDLEKAEAMNQNVEVTLQDETKNILDYTCKKAIIHDSEGNEMEIWYSDAIKMNTNGHQLLNQEVPGFPMEFSVNQGGLIMKITMVEFEQKLKDKEKSLFSFDIPEGYQEMTIDELQMMGM